MDVIDLSATLATLVTDHPEFAREFERHGFDYCCGGTETLASAIEGAGLDPAAVVDGLTAASTSTVPPSWASMDAVALMDHLVDTHHRYLWAELPRLTALVEKIRDVHGARHPELEAVRQVYEALRADLEPHLLKEERVLFPMARELASATSATSFHCGTLRNPISVMLREHDAVGDLLASLRRHTHGYRPPADGCASYVACYAALEELETDTHLHVHKENHLLFPMIVRMEAQLEAESEAGMARG